MKILTFGDIHLSRASLDAMAPSLAWVLDMACRLQPDLVVCLGDLVQSRNEHDHRVLGALLGFFDDLSCRYNLPTVTLVGNHDIQYGPDERLIYHDSLVHIVTPNTVIDWPCFWRGGADHHYSPIGFSPYYKDGIPVGAPFIELLFCHGDVADHPYGDVVLGPGVTAIGGPDSQVTHVFCGHQHIPEVIERTAPSGRRVYFEFVGCLAPQSFADAGDHPFGMVLVEYDEEEHTVIGVTRLPNPHARRYLKHTWREGQPRPELRTDSHHLVDVVGGRDFCEQAARELAPLRDVRVRQLEQAPSLASDQGQDPAATQAQPRNDYVDELIGRWGKAHGGDVSVGRALYLDQEHNQSEAQP